LTHVCEHRRIKEVDIALSTCNWTEQRSLFQASIWSDGSSHV